MKTLITLLGIAMLCIIARPATAQGTSAQPATARSATAQPAKPSTHDFIVDCMKSTGELPHKQLVLWIPTEYWEIVGGQMKLPPESLAIIEKELSPYMLFCVVDYSIEGTSLTFKSADDLRPTIKMVDSSKHVYLPLADNAISPMALKIVSQFQPAMAKILGQFGDGMHVFLFDAMGNDHRRSFDVAKPNRFLVTWEDVTAKYILPLPSVLPPKFCPVDKEQMQGNWSYCPIHGVKLE